MELDNKQLGRLKRVANPRDVWTSESGDFTPWLAENIDVLAEALGMALTVVGTEVSVGDFRLDVRAEDDEGRAVIIENQLERTDHSHLGQCLVYAAGLDASTVIWIAPQFRDDFRRAFDWLNQRTDLGINFFGVEVSVVQISDTGPRAPVFDVVSRPNNWQKVAKNAGEGPAGGSGTVSPVNGQRQDFFAEILSDAIRVQPAIRVPARSRQNWLALMSGPFGYWALSVATLGRLRIEAYIDTGHKEFNKELFDEFAASSEYWQQAVGFALSWERLDGKRASRIATYREVDLNDEASKNEARTWAASSLVAMFNAMNEPLRTRARQIRHAATAVMDAAETKEHDDGSGPILVTDTLNP